MLAQLRIGAGAFVLEVLKGREIIILMVSHAFWLVPALKRDRSMELRQWMAKQQPRMRWT